MITQNDLDIENLSYTKKDFGQIYPELLDLAKQLSSKWDPENTNESDPGIVLLKLAAFVADKNNYNIDKNILEQFLTSCTQETSMTRLCEMLGYNRHYYRSATTRMSFRFTGKISDLGDSYSAFRIKPFETTFTTEDGIIYTLFTPIGRVTEDNTLFTNLLAVEGELNTLSVLDNTTIQIQNLDSNNRVYFPDVEVAENGIVINGEYYDALTAPYAWRRVDNLNDQELGSRVYKFGYDSDKGFPYIEFPSDIATLIDSGLTIKYIVSKGSLGKVSQGELTTFGNVSIEAFASVADVDNTGTSLSSLDAGAFILSNSSSIGAADPETITESYDSAKKVIGTFDTLVSAQDYSNYINRYETDENKKIASNVVAADVRTDPAYSHVVFTRDSTSGVNSYYKTVLNTDTDQTAASPTYNITLHGFGPVNSAINNLNTYETTYSNITDSALQTINDAVYSVKSIAQSIGTPDSGALNVILGNYKLNVNITPTYKVNLSEEKEIINNVKQALYENFNSQKLDFGEEIPYDSLVDVMKNADERIKSISMAEPDIYYTYKDAKSNDAQTLSLEIDNKLIDLVAHNIVAGAMPLYYEDTSFNYDYSMDLANANAPVALLGGVANTEIKENAETTLEENQAVQVITDSFITKITYPVGVYYSFKAGSNTTTPLSANTPHQLQAGDVLYIAYTDSDDVAQFIQYTNESEYNIFIPSFAMTNCSTNGTVGGGSSKSASKFLDSSGKVVDGATKDQPNSAICMYYLGTNDQIEMVARNEVELPKNPKAFWYIRPRVAFNNDSASITNSEGNLIFSNLFGVGKTVYEYILEENEYFIYPSEDLLALNVCGSGTKILIQNRDDSAFSEAPKLPRDDEDSVIDLSQLVSATSESDLDTFENTFAWETIPSKYKVRVCETNIATYTAGDTIESSKGLNSAWSVPGTLTINGVSQTLSDIQNARVRTVTSFVSSAEAPYSTPATSAVTLFDSYGEALPDTSGKSFQTSTAVDTYNDLIFLGTMQYEVDGTTIRAKKDANGNYEYDYPCNVFCYSKSADVTSTSSNDKTLSWLIREVLNNNLITNSRGEYVLSHNAVKAAARDTTTYTVDVASDLGLSVAMYDTVSGKTQLFKALSSIDLSTFINENNDSHVLYISKPKKIELQSYINETGTDISNSIIAEVNSISGGKYDYLGEANSYKYITSYEPLTSFFDENNVYNKFTIAKIDFSNSKFSVVGGNLKYVKS